MNNVLKAVELLNTSQAVVNDYTRGGCWNFAEALRLLHNHPNGKVAYNVILGHAYYTYDRVKFYDIKGEHEFNPDRLSDFLFGVEILFFNPEKWCDSISDRCRWRVDIYDTVGVIVYQYNLNTFKEVELLIKSLNDEFYRNHSIGILDHRFEYSAIIKNSEDLKTMYKELEEEGIDVKL